MNLSKLQVVCYAVLLALPQVTLAQQYFQHGDDASLQDSFGYVPTSGNPWAIPPVAPPSYEYQPPRAQPYREPAAQPPARKEANPFDPSAQERYISEEELQRLERITDDTDLWGGTDAPDRAGEDYYASPEHAVPGKQDETWGKLDTQGLVGSSGYRTPPATQYPPYSFGMPGMYPPAPGIGQSYQPNPYYNLTSPRLDTRSMDNINSGAYINNSIAPFLY